MAKHGENLPLELLNRHLETLNLKDPLVIEDENALFTLDSKKRESAIVFLPKSKALIDMALSLVSTAVKADGTIILVGTKNGGIESAKKIYEKNIGPVGQKLIGNHSALYVGKNKKLSAGKKISDFFTTFSIPYMVSGKEAGTIEVANLPGVFSAGELDEGTKILLDHLPTGAKRFLDLACGSGVVGATYKKTSPETIVDFSDSSLLALEATKKTLEINKLEGNVIQSDVLSDITEEYDIIAINPPFHKGIDTDYSFIDILIMDVYDRLAKNGQIFIVANSFLSYREKLETIGQTTEVYRDKKFALYKTEKARIRFKNPKPQDKNNYKDSDFKY